jgi:hypothetical protein
MRIAIALTALALSLPAVAQQRPQARPPQPPTQQQTPEPPPGLFPCRTASEVCFIGIVTGNSQITLLFTNSPAAAPPPPPPAAQPPRGGSAGRAPQPPQPAAEDADDKPLDVLAGDPGTPLDLAQHLGRVVMLTGTLDPKLGLTKAELVEVASPLLSFALKATLTGDDDEPAAPPASGARAPGKR